MSISAAMQLGALRDFLIRLRCHDGPVLLEGDSAGFIGYRLGSGDDGAFVEWALKDGSFTLSTDRLGLFPLYYLQDGAELLISNSVTLIQQHCKLSLDQQAIAIFLRLGFYLGSDTAFKGVLRPQGQLKLLVNAAEQRLTVTKPSFEPSLHQHTAARYQELFSQALAQLKSVSLPLYVPVTGGKDSRHILLTTRQLELELASCYTVRVLSPHSNQDVSIARALCQQLGIPHQTLDSEQQLVQAERDKNTRTNFETYDHFWINPAGQYLASQAPGLVLDGFGGDVLGQSKIVTAQMYQLYQTRNWSALLQQIAPDNAYYQAYFAAKPEWLPNERQLLQRLQHEMEKYAADVNPVKSFYFWNRSRRAIAISSFRFLNGHSLPFLPFMQSQVFEFLMTLPNDLYYFGQFHSQCIAQAFPEFTAVPFATGEESGDILNLPTKFNNYQRLLGEILQADFITVAMRPRALLSCLRSHLSKDQAIDFFYFFRPMIYLNQLQQMTSHAKPQRLRRQSMSGAVAKPSLSAEA